MKSRATTYLEDLKRAERLAEEAAALQRAADRGLQRIARAYALRCPDPAAAVVSLTENPRARWGVDERGIYFDNGAGIEHRYRQDRYGSVERAARHFLLTYLPVEVFGGCPRALELVGETEDPGPCSWCEDSGLDPVPCRCSKCGPRNPHPCRECMPGVPEPATATPAGRPACPRCGGGGVVEAMNEWDGSRTQRLCACARAVGR